MCSEHGFVYRYLFLNFLNLSDFEFLFFFTLKNKVQTAMVYHASLHFKKPTDYFIHIYRHKRYNYVIIYIS